MTATRILIVDDHPLFRDALSQMLKAHYPDLEIEQAATFAAVTRTLEHNPHRDVVMLDLTMPGVLGFSGLTYLRAQYPALPLMVISAIEDPMTIRRCLDLGAAAYVPKSQPVNEIKSALDAVLRGEIWVPRTIVVPDRADPRSYTMASRIATLTPQQMRVLMMLAEGRANKDIAHELTVSEATIKAHVSAILEKLHVDSRTQAVIALGQLGPTTN